MENLKLEKCQFHWNYWRGDVREFVNKIRSKSMEEKFMCHRTGEGSKKNNYSWNLPAVVMVIQDYKQGQLSVGELFMVMSIKVQRRVQLRRQDNKIVTLPYSTNLKFHEFQNDKEEKPKSRSLRSLVKQKLSVDNKNLTLQLAEEHVRSVDDSSQFLSGLLTLSGCYEENFLICLPVNHKSEQGMQKLDFVTIPAYYPIKLATANALIDSSGSDRLEDLYRIFIASSSSMLSVFPSTLQELTISSFSGELYEEIDEVMKTIKDETADCEQEVRTFNSNFINATSKFNFKTNEIPLTSQQIKNEISSDFTYLSPTTNSSPNLNFNDEIFLQVKNKRNIVKKRAMPRTPVNKIIDENAFDYQFASIPKNMFATKKSQNEEYKKDFRNIETKLPLTTTKSMIDISILSRDVEHQVKTKCSNTQKDGNLKTCETSKMDVIKPNKKHTRSTALGQLFNIFKKHNKNNDRRNKSLSCTERGANKHILFNYQDTSNDYSEISGSPYSAYLNDDNSNNDYDNIGSTLINKTVLNFGSENLAPSKRPLSKSMDALNENITTQAIKCIEDTIESEAIYDLLCYSNPNLSERQITSFKASPNIKFAYKDEENSNKINYNERIEDNLKYEVVSSQRNSPVGNSRNPEIKDSNNYIDMVTTYITSDNESVKSYTSCKWTTLQEVPKDISELIVNEVCDCLDLLNLSKYTKRFHCEQIDGRLLCSLTREILQKDLEMSQFEALKLMKFVKEGWRL